MTDSRSSAGRSAPWGSCSRHHTTLLLLMIVAAGFLLRLYQIGSEGLWIDEAFSVWLAQRPLGEMLRWVQDVDHHPPLYYALLHGWTAIFGLGEGSVPLDAVSRALSALFGGLTVPAVYVLGRRMANERVGLVSALILALSPFHVRFAQEARMYTLLAFQATLALCAFVRLYGPWARSGSRAYDGFPDSTTSSSSPDRTRIPPLTWVGYVAFTAAMLWTHNTAILFPAATNLVVLGTVLVKNRALDSGSMEGAASPCSCRPRGVLWLRSWFAAQAVILLLWLPWLPSFISQAGDVYRRFWLPAPTLGSVLGVIGAFLCDAPSWPFLLVAWADIGLGLLALYGLRVYHHRSANAVLLGVMLLTPLAAEWFVSLWRPILYARTLIWASIPLYLMVAAGVIGLEIHGHSKATSRWVVLAALIALVAIDGAALGSYYTTTEKESWDDAAALVAQRVESEDLLLFNDAWGQIPFDYYFSRLYNPDSDPAVTKHGLPVDLFDRGVLEPEMREQDLPELRRLIAGRQRVWLVYSHQWYTDPKRLIPQVLARRLNLDQQWAFEGVEVQLYVAD